MASQTTILLTTAGLAMRLNGRVYDVIEVATVRVLVGGEEFETRREAKAFMETARGGYTTYEPYNPMSDAPVEAIPLASPEVCQARWESKKRDNYLMSPRGFNEED